MDLILIVAGVLVYLLIGMLVRYAVYRLDGGHPIRGQHQRDAGKEARVYVVSFWPLVVVFRVLVVVLDVAFYSTVEAGEWVEQEIKRRRK